MSKSYSRVKILIICICMLQLVLSTNEHCMTVNICDKKAYNYIFMF